MSERQSLSLKDRIQEQPKEPYAPPQLTYHGTVAELTQNSIPSDECAVGSEILDLLCESSS